MAIVRSPWDSQYTCAVFFFNWAVANPTGWYCSVEGFFSWLKVLRNQPVHMGTSFTSMLFAGTIPWLVNSNICEVYIPFLKVTWIASSSLITPDFSLLNPNLWCLMLKSPSFVVRSWFYWWPTSFFRVIFVAQWDLSAEVWASRWALQGGFVQGGCKKDEGWWGYDNIGQEWTRYGG